MLQHKRKVLLVFGGRSGEHEVSIVSASHVLQALDPEKYDVELVGITKQGEWVQVPKELPLSELDNPERQFRPRLLSPQDQAVTGDARIDQRIDVVLPVLHGPFGEDGTLQGFLELAGLPYVGCGVLASAVAMDKVTAKRIFRDAGIPVVSDQLVLASQLTTHEEPKVLDRLERELSFPMFVKPANLGSSVGVSKAQDRDSLGKALQEAATFDRRILVESAVPHVREIEVAVLGNDNVRVSVPGEIVPDRDFYDYESKYGNDSTSTAKIPAELSRDLIERIQLLAEQAYRAIDGAGMARVDFLLNGETNELYLNEINTIPGFTPISMYPKLWEASGVSYGELLDELIRLALERGAEKRTLKTSRV